jgi:hypothetical protein
MSANLPQVQSEFFPMGGGLDLVTPQIALSPGKLFDAQNYEPEVSGGYSRIDGYERFDGRQAPTGSPYWIMQATITGTLAVGNNITGLTSSATGRILYIDGTKLVLGRVTGTFANTEALQVAAVTQATSTTTAVVSNEPDASNDADYTLLAANDRRADIVAVPGSGPIRGVAVYKDTVYAFRDNAGGTAGDVYKSTAAGWVQVALGTEIQFTTGLSAIVAGNTITGGTSGATATVKNVLVRTGSWGSAALGTLVITPISGVWQSGESIKVGATNCATSSSLATAITRLPGGRVEYVNANFSGSTDTQRLYGCDTVNLAFEFDGTTYVPIRTGMLVDTPTHIMFHRFYLVMSYRSSVQLSAIGNPYAWSVILGAAELALGDDIVGFMPQGGNAAGSTLGIFTKTRTYMMYGSTTANFTLVVSVFDMGYYAYTFQPVSNNTYGLTARGIQSLITTLTYGDFDYSSISHLIQPFMFAKRGLEIASTSLRAKDQYRLYFSDGTGLVLGLTGDKVSGMIPINYGRAVRCITTVTNSTGTEMTYFGSDDGYIYTENIGTSFDGQPIEAWIRPAFNHSKSPRIRKRYRRVVFEVKPYGYSKININYDLGYANPDVMPPEGISNSAIFAGGFWDQVTWDQFTWDAKVFADISMSLTGTEKNISFLFYSNRAQDKKHTVHGLTLSYSPQRAER